MRDFNRIRKFCETLANVWEQVPDWRFCQLIANIYGDHIPFYLEDDKALDALLSLS